MKLKKFAVKSPKESLPQTESSITPEYYSQKVVEYRDKIQSLEAALADLQTTDKLKDQTIAELQAALVSLTEENIQLRAKLTNFKDLKELNNGIEQTAELLKRSQKADFYKPVATSDQELSIFTEIDLLKETLNKKKKEYDFNLKSQSLNQAPKAFEIMNLQSEPFQPLSPLNTENKPRRDSKKPTRRLSKRHTSKYIPSYLRQQPKKSNIL